MRCLLFAAGPLTHANLHLPLCLLTVRTLDPREVTGVMLGHRARQGQAALGSVWPTLILLRVPCVCVHACGTLRVCMRVWLEGVGWGTGPRGVDLEMGEGLILFADPDSGPSLREHCPKDHLVLGSWKTPFL